MSHGFYIHFSNAFHKFSFREFLVFWITGFSKWGEREGGVCNIRVDTWTLDIGQREENRRNHFSLALAEFVKRGIKLNSKFEKKNIVFNLKSKVLA